jgi:hydrogenase maturation protease
MKTVVVGIGNVLMSDDGVGVHVVNALRERYHDTEEITFIDGGTKGLDLLPYIEGADGLLIVDAVNAGKEPGTVVFVEGRDVPSYLSQKLSVHQISVPDLLFSAEFLGVVPRNLSLIGVQPLSLEVSIDLSPEVKAAMAPLTDAVKAKLAAWGVTLVPRETPLSIVCGVEGASVSWMQPFFDSLAKNQA